MKTINNAIYEQWGEKWRHSNGDAIALLRAEHAFRNPWICALLAERAQSLGGTLQVLDAGCGGGLLSEVLAQKGHSVTGLDLSPSSLRQARDSVPKASFVQGDVTKMPFPDACFDVVCAVDVIEHVEDQDAFFREVSRVLKAKGLFVFYTFNKTLAAKWLVVHGVPLRVKDTPPQLHVYDLFLSPKELQIKLNELRMEVKSLRGVRPRFATWDFLRLLLTGHVSESLPFCWTQSLQVAYAGAAEKRAS